VLDPVVDRLLVISGVVVCWKFALLPRWALAVLVARELFMLVAGRAALRRGAEIRINWWGRWAVWPLMSALFFGLCGLKTVAAVLLFLGLFLSLTATVMYVRDVRVQLRPDDASPSSSS
jgi:cardiolipin synthase